MFSSSSQLIFQRPSLHVKYSTSPSELPASPTYPVTVVSPGRTLWVSSSLGNDLTGSGDSIFPVRSLRRALDDALPGDTINLMNGSYAGGLAIYRSRLTLQSAPGHWAVISSPLNDPIAAVNVLTVRSTSQFGVIRNVEITGGYYYGIMFWTDWGNYATTALNVNLAAAAAHYLLENVRIHHTGSSCVKMVMKVSNITFRNSELAHCGERFRTYGHGIEGVQAHHVTVQDCYLHDIPGAGIHLVGGSSYALILRNFISNSGFGMNIGFTTDYDLFDTIHNPLLYENMHAVVANNIISVTLNAGINLWAAYNASLLLNTIWNAQHLAQSAILIDSYQHVDAPKAPVIGCSRLTIVGNILTKATYARVGPILSIRTSGFNSSSPLLLAGNVYFDSKGVAGNGPWQWAHGAMFEDDRDGLTMVGNLTAWKLHCHCDAGSMEANPRLDRRFSPLACSPALAVVDPTLLAKWPSSLLLDFNGNARQALTWQSAGAVSPSVILQKPMPPMPSVLLTAPAPSNQVGLPVAYYDTWTWPFGFWLGRVCRDLYVDAVSGSDAQTFNYQSNYSRPFKTIQAALISINQCDRVLLKGNQTHWGHFGIYRPNVTIMTDPRDSIRATVRCDNVGKSPCIIAGDGFYDGAAELTLSNFNLVMSGKSTSTCIQLNEGYGGAYSPYWRFYVENSGRANYSRGFSLIERMDISGCALAGVKLSTFITGVVLSHLHIHGVNTTGVELRNGNNVTVRHCLIENVLGSGVLLGGGSRNILVEWNTIRQVGGRGVLVGSDNTEVQYMDTEYATKHPTGSWHDAINVTVRNNVIAHTGDAGLAFYSARDVVAVHNTLLDVAQSAQAAVLLNLSPKTLNNTYQTMLANRNISLANNIVEQSNMLVNGNLPMVEARIMQVTLARVALPPLFPDPSSTGNCSGFPSTSNSNAINQIMRSTQGEVARRLTSPVLPRRSDGSCRHFPADNPWHRNVSGLPLHPNGDSIRSLIRNGGHLHPDFGGGFTVMKGSKAMFVPYGIPITTVNTLPLRGQPGVPLVPISIAASGYPSECDYPLLYPFPSTAAVEGAYLNCPDNPCSGDRHVLVIDNSTCQLYETWRSFPPNVTAGRGWVSDIAVKFDLSSNALRPLGFTSSDAAGLPVAPGLVQFEEVITRGFINHALRFTGPNSRAAYALPATHFAPAGDSGPDSPWMGLRVRLNSSFDCSQLARAARVVCVALKTYGGIFADNGSPWYFSGEATTKWLPYVSELQDLTRIPASQMLVLDDGSCLCLDAACSVTECSSGASDPNARQVYSAIDSDSQLRFSHNFYYNMAAGSKGRFADRRTGYLGRGYDGDLAGWQTHIRSDNFSLEIDPRVDFSSYRLLPNSPAHFAVPLLSCAAQDEFGGPVARAGANLVNAGVLFANYTPAPSAVPSRKPTALSTWLPTFIPTLLPTRRPSGLPTSLPVTAVSTNRPTSLRPSQKPTSASPTSDPAWKTISFQSGSMLGGVLYNSSYDTQISTLYSTASYSNYNGYTAFYGSGSQFQVSNGSDQFRLLLRFDNLSQFIPPGSTVVQAQLVLTLGNWVTSSVRVCALMNKHWDRKQIVVYKGTGWRLNRWVPTGESRWTSPGAIADCDPATVTSPLFPASGYYVSLTVPLAASTVSSWLTGIPAANSGLLIWARTGNVNVFSTTSAVLARRPRLLITYTTPATGTPTTNSPTAALITSTLTSPISALPTATPIGLPTNEPTTTSAPTSKPTTTTTTTPTIEPTATSTPTNKPTTTTTPTIATTTTPTIEPTATSTPTNKPTTTSTPTNKPTASSIPTNKPTTTRTPTSKPTTTGSPTSKPTSTASFTRTPTNKPTKKPTSTGIPTNKPTIVRPTLIPTSVPFKRTQTAH